MKTFGLLLITVILITGCAEQVTSSMKSSNEVAMMMDLRMLHTAQVQYKMRNQRYGTLEELHRAGLIGPAMGAGKKHGYIITSVSASANEYAVRADPETEDKLQRRHFYMDQTSTIRANHTKPAGPDNPPAKQ